MKTLAFAGDFPITQIFGVNPAAYSQFGLAGHNGVDFGLPTGTTVRAVEAGTVIELTSDPAGYGLTVYVAADSGRGWRYGHLEQFAITQGQHVDAGQTLGLSDNTGNSTGPHLHLGMRPVQPNFGNGFNGYEDPLPVLTSLSQATQEDTVTPEDQALLDAVKGSGIADAQAYTDLVNWTGETYRELQEAQAQLAGALATQAQNAPAVVKVLVPANVTVDVEPSNP